MKKITRKVLPVWTKILLICAALTPALMVYKCTIDTDQRNTINPNKSQRERCIDVCIKHEHRCRTFSCYWNSDNIQACIPKCIAHTKNCLDLCDKTWDQKYENPTVIPSSSSSSGQ